MVKVRFFFSLLLFLYFHLFRGFVRMGADCVVVVVPDGYGLAYAIGDNHLRWTITSLKRDTAKLRDALEEAADETRKMAEAAGVPKPKPKL